MAMCGPIFTTVLLIAVLFMSSGDAQAAMNGEMATTTEKYKRVSLAHEYAMKTDELDLQSMPYIPQCGIGNCYFCNCIGKSESFSLLCCSPLIFTALRFRQAAVDANAERIVQATISSTRVTLGRTTRS